MRKVESTRTLCDYYNEIVYKVNQLTEMCGNTEGAIKLRDDIYDMFTVKFSEPLDDIAELQEDLGCPLEVIERLFRQDFVYFKYPANVQIMKVKVCKGLFYGTNPGWYFTGVYDNVDFIHASLRDYKKTWWLKENRSM